MRPIVLVRRTVAHVVLEVPTPGRRGWYGWLVLHLALVVPELTVHLVLVQRSRLIVVVLSKASVLLPLHRREPPKPPQHLRRKQRPSLLVVVPLVPAVVLVMVRLG